MTANISTEIYWLVATIAMTSLFWTPYIINRMLEQGVINAVWDRYGHTVTQKEWANRMMQAHNNAIENLVVFSPLVIIVEILQLNTVQTATACMIYFFARLIHYLAFSFAIPLLRVVTFLTGFGVQIFLAIQLVG